MDLQKLQQENFILKNNYNFTNNINEINMLRNENNNLKQQLFLKQTEINNWLLQIQNNKSNQNKFVNFNDIIVINFISTNQEITNCSIKCLKTDTFAEVEERLYQIYDNYRNTNNIFVVSGKQILRFK